jgi:hypothetical protein
MPDPLPATFSGTPKVVTMVERSFLQGGLLQAFRHGALDLLLVDGPVDLLIRRGIQVAYIRGRDGSARAVVVADAQGDGISAIHYQHDVLRSLRGDEANVE